MLRVKRQLYENFEKQFSESGDDLLANNVFAFLYPSRAGVSTKHPKEVYFQITFFLILDLI